MMIKKYVVIGVATLCSVVLLQAQLVQAKVIHSPDQWTITVQPYLWASDVSGEIKDGTQSYEFELKFSDAIEQLDMAYASLVEIRKDPWVILGDIYFAKLSADGTSPNYGPLHVEFKQWMAELGGGYQVYCTTLGKNSDNDLVLEFLGGGRYFNASPRIETADGALLSDKTKDWFEPYIGARVLWNLSEHWYGGLRGDVGGFGIGEAAELTTNYMAEIGYRFNDTISLSGGYRYLNIDYGNDIYDASNTMKGPWLSVGFTF